MRPHVELVYQQDLIWHDSDLGGAGARAEMRRLSSDEESGAATVLARFGSNNRLSGQESGVRWSRPAGYHLADTEWFVLSGRVTVGETELGAGGYLRAPAGKLTPPMSAEAGSLAVVFCDNGPLTFVASSGDWADFVRRDRRDISGLPGELTVTSAADLDWEPAPWEPSRNVPAAGEPSRNVPMAPTGLPERADGANGPAGGEPSRNVPMAPTGPPERADGANGPAAGEPAARVKVLYRQRPLAAATTAEPVTVLWEAPPGWADPSFHHRGVFAEAYGLSGVIEYSHGRLSEGGYLYRPPRLQTSAARVAGDAPARLLVRLGDTAVPWHTSDPYVRVSGHAVNYDPSTALENLVPSGLSVTSRSTKLWVAQYHPRAEPGAPSPSGRFVNAIQ